MHLSRLAGRGELVAAVTAPLAAFRADDWEQAYAAAARSFQSVVPLPQLVALISRNYPVGWENTRAEFGIPSDNGTVAIVPVRVFGRAASAAYHWLLVKEAGGWRVTGVVPQRTTGGA